MRRPQLATLLALSLVFSGCTTHTEKVIVHDVGSPVRALSDDGKNRLAGFFSSLPDPSAAPPQQSRAVYGSGEFVGERAPSILKAAARDVDGRTYTLNLVSATVPEAAAAVLGDIYRVNYTVDSKIDSLVTIQTSRPVDKAGVAELFEAALRSIGAAIVKNGNVYRVVTADQSAMGASLSGNGDGERIGNGLKIVPLRYIAAAEMKRILEPMATFGGMVRVDNSRNALTLSGTEQEIAAMEEAISVFDVDVMRGMSFAMVPMRGVEPEAVVGDLDRIFAASAEGPMAGMVQFVPNNRLKSMLIISKQPHYLAEAQRWVQRLDEQGAGERRQFHTYIVRNRQAQELVGVLNDLFASENSGESPRPVAPTSREPLNGNGSPPAVTASLVTGGAANGGSSRDVISSAFDADLPRPSQAFASVPLGVGMGGGEGTSAGFGSGAGGEPRIKIVADSSQNALLILASAADYKRVERVIANLDVIPNQVLIEATIAEVTLSDDLQFGVRWFLQNKSGSRSSAFSELVSGAVGSAFPGFSFVAKAAGGQITLNALNSVGHVNVLASPSLMVLDRKTATLQIGDQVPIKVQSAESVTTPGAPIVNSIAYKDTGVILSITPRINESGRVLLDIEQEVSNVQPNTSSGIDSPSFTRRRVKTSVVVSNGESVTLGGLIHDRHSQIDSQVPVLGDIPIFGNAFKDRKNIVEKTELIIMLTPRVVRDLNEAQAVTDEYRRKIELFAPRRKDPSKKILHNVRRVVE